MALQLRIDQAGLSNGIAGTSRTDGLATGALVTLINTGSGSTTAFRLLWTPPGDITAVASLISGEDPKVWTFEPTPDKYGTYLIELIEDEGLLTELRERRAFVVRTPGRGLVIPALNERGDARANIINSGFEQIEAAENNAVDFEDPALNDVPYAAWWRSFHEVALAVDSAAGPEPGEFEGQALRWNGAQWKPDGGEGLKLNFITNTPTDAGLVVITESSIQMTSNASGLAATTIIDCSKGGIYQQEASITNEDGPRDGGHLFQTRTHSGLGAASNLKMGVLGEVPTLRFLDDSTPVPRQSIAGSTTQEQVNSLVAALTALGLVTDDRP